MKWDWFGGHVLVVVTFFFFSEECWTCNWIIVNSLSLSIAFRHTIAQTLTQSNGLTNAFRPRWQCWREFMTNFSLDICTRFQQVVLWSTVREIVKVWFKTHQKSFVLGYVQVIEASYTNWQGVFANTEVFQTRHSNTKEPSRAIFQAQVYQYVLTRESSFRLLLNADTRNLRSQSWARWASKLIVLNCLPATPLFLVECSLTHSRLLFLELVSARKNTQVRCHICNRREGETILTSRLKFSLFYKGMKLRFEVNKNVDVCHRSRPRVSLFVEVDQLRSKF